MVSGMKINNLFSPLEGKKSINVNKILIINILLFKAKEQKKPESFTSQLVSF